MIVGALNFQVAAQRVVDGVNIWTNSCLMIVAGVVQKKLTACRIHSIEFAANCKERRWWFVRFKKIMDVESRRDVV